ncbi:MAG: shikimate dehydrogenase [Gammaproteobacteria bacterium]|nr:shikimate dehydrogenase [Gammaproteobacteria bacterium]
MSDTYAVIGNPIAHSLSPVIHRAFAAQVGVEIEYQKLLAPRDGFDGCVRDFFNRGGLGLNVTAPFKVNACVLADELSEEAAVAGAVNTLILKKNGSLQGANTDGVGLVADLLNNLRWPLHDCKLLLLGAGGASRGALLPLLRARPAALHIANRTVDKARQLAQEFSRFSKPFYVDIKASGLEDCPPGFDLIINASAASLKGDLPPLAKRALGRQCRVYDMAYAAQATPFVRWAVDAGAIAAADGLGMLVAQAAESFSLWRGVKVKTAPVLAQLRRQLTANAQS